MSMLGYAAVIIARRQAGRRPVVVGAGVLDGGLARLPAQARVNAAVVGSTAAAVTLDYASQPADRPVDCHPRAMPAGRQVPEPGHARRRAVGWGFVVARFGWSLDDAISRDEDPSSGPVGARMGDGLYHSVGKHLQTVTGSAWRGTFGIWEAHSRAD